MLRPLLVIIKNMVKAFLSDGDNFIELIWFNSPFIKKNIKEGDLIRVIGKIRKNRNFQMVNPKYVKIKKITENIGKKKMD